MTAGDKGVQIIVNAGGYDLTGSTCALLVAPNPAGAAFPTVPPPGVAVTLTPMTVAPNGLTATYTTTGTDFPSGGEWSAQLEVTTSGGESFTSPPGSFYIYPRL